MLWSQSFWACPGAMGEGRDCSLYLVLTEACWWSGSAWEGVSIRSGGAWGCFCWRVSRDSLLGLTKELSPDSICKAPLMLKSDSFWFTRLFIFVAGSLWALFCCEVACLGETSETVRFQVCVDSWLYGTGQGNSLGFWTWWQDGEGEA